MRQKQLKNQLENILHEFVHLKTVSFGYRINDGKVHDINNYTNIYLGFKKSDIQNIGWVSENIQGTAYVKNNISVNNMQTKTHLWKKVQKLILEYANTPLKDRQDEYVIAVGQNADGRLAVYSKDSYGIVQAPIKTVERLSSFHFTDNDSEALCNELSPMFRDNVKNGKIPLSKIEKMY